MITALFYGKNASKSNFKKLENTQKRAARMILEKGNSFSSNLFTVYILVPFGSSCF